MPTPITDEDATHSESALPMLPDERKPPSNLFSGELHHAVWRLAWPSVTTMLLQTVNSLLDVFFVGHLPNGSAALAATGAGGGVIFLLISLAMGVTVGTTALVARFTGAREPHNAIQATAQSITLSVLLGLLFGIPMYFARDWIAAAILNAERSPDAVRLCSEFLGASLLATIPLFVGNVFLAAFRGLGDTHTPLRTQIVMVSTHIALNFVLIQGRLGFPAWGVKGAGVALAISLVVSMILNGWALARSPVANALRRNALTPHREWFARILRIGIPASVQAVARTASMMLFTRMLANTVEGTAAVAALNLGIRVEAIAFMPGFGYGVAAAALVGQNLGAKNPDRAEQSGWAATYQAVGVMTFMAIVFYVFADPIAARLAEDPAVRKLSADFLRINGLVEPFLALGMVLTNALQGAGETFRPTLITLITMIVIRLPLADVLMFRIGMQTHGAWLSMAITTVAGGLLTVWLFRSGVWKKVRV
jgi:putative MATE family efflux protein